MPCVHRKHAAKYEREFLDDLQRLGCLMPSLLTRVSDFIPEIRAYIDKIHENGMAYANSGSVYFDTQAFRCVHETTEDRQLAISSSLIALRMSKSQHPSLLSYRWHESQYCAATDSPFSLSRDPGPPSRRPADIWASSEMF